MDVGVSSSTGVLAARVVRIAHILSYCSQDPVAFAEALIENGPSADAHYKMQLFVEGTFESTFVLSKVAIIVLYAGVRAYTFVRYFVTSTFFVVFFELRTVQRCTVALRVL